VKKILAGMLIVMLALAASGCQTESTDKKAALQEITIGLMPDVDSMPFIIAQEKGYFKEEGINVTIQQFKSAMDRDSALQSGNLDGAISDLLAVAFAKAGGFDVKVTSFTDGSYKLIAGANETANNVADLQGKDVAVSKNTIIEYVTDQILMANQMTDSNINKVVIPQIPTRLEMLQNGKLAAATLPEPMASIAIQNGCKLLSSSDQLAINPGVILFTNKAIEGKKPEIQAMYRAYNKAVAYLNTQARENYIDLLIEKGGFPPAAKDALLIPTYREAALPAEKDVVDCIQWLNHKELIKQSYTYQDIVTNILGQ